MSEKKLLWFNIHLKDMAIYAAFTIVHHQLEKHREVLQQDFVYCSVSVNKNSMSSNKSEM